MCAEMQAKDAGAVVCLLESRSEDAVGVATSAMLRLLSGRVAGANVGPLAEAGAFRAVALLLKSSEPPSDDNAAPAPTPTWAINPQLSQRLAALVDRALGQTLSLLSRGRTPKEWEVAALALQSLTLYKGSCARFADSQASESPRGVLWLLSEVLAHGTATAKQRAARTLGNLAAGGQSQWEGVEPAEAGAGAEPVGKRALELLVRMLSESIPGVQEAVAWALSKLARNYMYVRKEVEGIGGALEAVVKLLGSSDPGVRAAAAAAAGGLASPCDNGKAIQLASMGAAVPLARMLREGTPPEQMAAADAAEALAQKGLVRSHREYLEFHFVSPLAGMLRGGTQAAKEAACSALCELACYGEEEFKVRIKEENCLGLSFAY